MHEFHREIGALGLGCWLSLAGCTQDDGSEAADASESETGDGDGDGDPGDGDGDGEPGDGDGDGDGDGEPGDGDGDGDGDGAPGDGDGDGDGDGAPGDGDGDGAPQDPPAVAAELQLSFSQIKQFEFSWTPVVDADVYRLLERIQPNDNFVQIAADEPGDMLTLSMPLHLRVGATYILQSCNTGGCVDSAPLEVAPTLTEAIGYFKASNAQGEDYFGGAVSLSSDGRTLAVAASWEDSDATGIDGNQASDPSFSFNSGAVYVFVETGGVWSQQAYIKSSNTGGGDHFGSKLALSASGDTLAVGSIFERSASPGIDGDQDDNSLTLAGAVYVFERDGQNWSQQAYIKASNPGAWDRFGSSLALSSSGDTLAVAAPYEGSAATGINGDQANDNAANAGAVYVFERSGEAWQQSTYVKASNTGSGDNFGFSLALSGAGDRLAVGAWTEDSAATGIDGDQASNARTDSGAVYVFDQINGAWQQTAYVKASNTGGGDSFGTAVALSQAGDRLVVGALREDSSATGVDGDQLDNSVSNSGAAYVFDELNGVWAQQAYLKPANPGIQNRFGNYVAISADGLVIAVAAFEEDNAATGIDGPLGNIGASNSGSAYVFTLGMGAWSDRAYVKASNTGSDDTFGQELALSSDGALLVVSAQAESGTGIGINPPQDNNGIFASGAVYLY